VATGTGKVNNTPHTFT